MWTAAAGTSAIKNQHPVRMHTDVAACFISCCTMLLRQTLVHDCHPTATLAQEMLAQHGTDLMTTQLAATLLQRGDKDHAELPCIRLLMTAGELPHRQPMLCTQAATAPATCCIAMLSLQRHTWPSILSFPDLDTLCCRP